MILLLTLSTLATEFHNVGKTPYDLIEYKDQIISVNSGYQSEPSLSLIKKGQSVITRNLPKGTNPYRGAFDGKNLWVSFNLTDELVKVSPEPFFKGTTDIDRVYQPDLSTTGAESIAIANDRIWLSYVNLSQSFEFGRAQILVFNKGGEFKQKLTLIQKNAKTLERLSDDRLAILTGVYGHDDGALLIVDTPKVPNTADLDLEKQDSSSFMKTILLGGTPSAISEYNHSLVGCDLSVEGKGRLFHVTDTEVVSKPIEVSRCSAILATEKGILLTRLMPERSGLSDDLLVYGWDLEKKCSIKFSQSSYPFDLLIKGNSLFVALSGIGQVAEIEMKDGLPKGCLAN